MLTARSSNFPEKSKNARLLFADGRCVGFCSPQPSWPGATRPQSIAAMKTTPQSTSPSSWCRREDWTASLLVTGLLALLILI